jgi:Arm DNA-binding domain
VRKLTKRTVDAIRPIPGRDAFIWDGLLKGFGVRMKPSGVGSYFVQYRNAEGRTRRLVLGRVGTLTPDQARTLAAAKLAQVANGNDPSAERKTQRNAVTVGEVCDWYLVEAQAGRLIGRKGWPIKASTLTMDRSRIEQHVKPLLADENVEVEAVGVATLLERRQGQRPERQALPEDAQGWHF